ncbi:NAD(P)-binding protein [Auriculariales sp. MPI-PUGE-AT-0066]|nr:NAD(P)-binding protein [Auriculariales sp. MPI-PUGE-AT-0066]
MYSTFGVIGGTGLIGAAIVKALIQQGAKRVVILARKGSSSQPPETEPTDVVSIVRVDYEDSATVVNALSGLEVVISAVGFTMWHLQPGLADAAKAAGAKLFVPSEWGIGTSSSKVPAGGLTEHKREIYTHLRSIGLPFCGQYTGFWPDVVFIPSTGFDLEHGKASVIGDGNTPISWTTREDAAYFTAYILTHFSAAQLENQLLNVEGSKGTENDAIRIIEEVKKIKLEVTRLDAEEVEHDCNEQGMKKIVEYIGVLAHKGFGDVDNLEGIVANHLIPGWKPLTLEEAIRRYIK